MTAPPVREPKPTTEGGDATETRFVIESNARYWRSKDGGTIHDASCRFARRGLPWLFVEREPMTDDAVAQLVQSTPWLRFGNCCIARSSNHAPAPREPKAVVHSETETT